MAFAAGQRVTINGRTGVVLLDNSANVAVNVNPGVFVAFADQTYGEFPAASLVNATGGWIVGVGPGQ